MAKADIPKLVAAAQTIENEQRRLEDLAHSLHKTKLHTDKSIGRAARELQNALEQQQLLADSLRGLGEAMGEMQERQQAAVLALQQRAAEIQTRRARLAEHTASYAALGSKTAEILESMSSLDVVGRKAAATATHDKLSAIIEEASTLGKTAREEGFIEVANEADTLRQKFQHIRTQLGSQGSQAN